MPADMEEIDANPEAQATCVVLEARLDRVFLSAPNRAARA